MRPALLLALSLLLALTSQALASARGQAAVAGEMVICSGGQLVTVPVDASGQPVEAPHICPDCALHALAGLTAPASAALIVPSCLDLVLPVTAQVATSLTALAPRARAPPAGA